MSSASRNDNDTDDDHRDSRQTLRADGFVEQVPGQPGIDHVADRQHRIGDADFDSRQRQDPDDDADDVASEATDDRPIGRQRRGDRPGVGERKIEMPELANAALEQQLGKSVEQHAEQDQRKFDQFHFLNLTAYQNVAHKAGQISAYQFLKNGQQIGTGGNIAERIFLALPIRSERLV